MIPPDTTPYEAPPPADCAGCDAPLEPGQRWRCVACVQAARRAVEEAGPGRVVRPSDVARMRERRER